MNKLIFLAILITILSGCMEKRSKVKVSEYPIPCFNSADVVGCETDLVPMPSDYMRLALPESLPLNFNEATPFYIKFSTPVKKSTADEQSIIVFENETKLSSDEIVISYGKTNDVEDTSKMYISHKSGKWNKNAKYTITLLNDLKDVNDEYYGRPLPFFIAVSDFPTVDENGNSQLPDVSNEEALMLQYLQTIYRPIATDIAAKLDKTLFDIVFLFTFQFKTPIFCFNEGSVSGCENDLIPMPSDFMSQVLPANTHLNIPALSPLSFKLSDKIDKETLLSSLSVFEITQTGITPVTNENLMIVYGKTDEIEDSSKITIYNKSGSWNYNSQYVVLLTKGLKTDFGQYFDKPITFYFAVYKKSLLDANGDVIPELSQVLTKENATTLEYLRQQYVQLITTLETVIKKDRKDFIMVYTMTFGEPFIIPCFNSKSFPGCETSLEAPLPSDFIMAYNEDGSHHLNLPIDEDASEMYKMLLTNINTLDGWSTSKPFSINVSDDIDEATLDSGLTGNPSPNVIVAKVKENDVELEMPVVVPVKATYNSNFKQIIISPLFRKFDEKSTYIVLLKNSVKGLDGESFVKSIPFNFLTQKETLLDENGDSIYAALDKETATMLEGGRLQFKPVFDQLDSLLNIKREDITMLWTVTTQSVTDTIKAIRTGMLANTTLPKVLQISTIIEEEQFSTVFNGIPLDNASLIAFGTFTAPYFISSQTGAFDPLKLAGNLTAEDFKNIPVIIAFPKTENLASETKVIIFQHGYTRQKEDVLPMINTFTQAGYIVIAPDMPLHGGRTANPVDLIDNRTGANTPDGIPDNSGEGYISVNVFGTRDILRQTVLEQVWLVNTLKSINFNTIDSDIQFTTVNAENINYMGHSLGTIVGNIFNSIETSIKSAILNVPGAIISNILSDTSESISGVIIDELALMGIEQGTIEYEQFMYLAQTVVDPGDSINYKRDGAKILIQKAINDPVIPNSSTDDLGVAVGLINPLTGVKNTQYFKEYEITGDETYYHSFILLPTNATAQGHLDIINFLNE